MLHDFGCACLRSMDLVVLFSMLLLLAATTYAGKVGSAWPFPAVTYLSTGLLLGASLWFKDKRSQWLLIFGLATGIAELPTDWIHVVVLKSLVYQDLSLFPVLASPEYMPLGWMNVIMQMGYLALRLMEIFRLPMPIVMLIIGMLGTVNIPYYEEMAYNARAWYYTSAWKIGHTPVWIVVTYLTVIPWVVPIVAKIERLSKVHSGTLTFRVIYTSIMGGILMGAIIFIGGYIAHTLFDKTI